MEGSSHKARRGVVLGLAGLLAAAALARLVCAAQDLALGDETAFLAAPLGVFAPGLAFWFLARRRAFASAEGVLMQLGAMSQLVLIVALPCWALHLLLGLPVVFLLVELFETRAPRQLRDPIRARLLA